MAENTIDLPFQLPNFYYRQVGRRFPRSRRSAFPPPHALMRFPDEASSLRPPCPPNVIPSGKLRNNAVSAVELPPHPPHLFRNCQLPYQSPYRYCPVLTEGETVCSPGTLQPSASPVTFRRQLTDYDIDVQGLWMQGC